MVGASLVGQNVGQLAFTIAVVGEIPLDCLWHAVPSLPTMSEIWLRLMESYGFVENMLHHSSLEIHQREEQGIDILDLHDKVEMGNGDVALREFVENLLGQGKRSLILDLAHVSAIDTAGPGVLLFAAQQYQAARGKLALFKLDPIHAQIYELVQLETAIEIYPDELGAVNSFFSDSGSSPLRHPGLYR